MAINPSNQAAFEEKVKEAYEKLSKKNPQWRQEEYYKEIAKQFHRQPRTIQAIILEEYERRRQEVLDPNQLSLFDAESEPQGEPQAEPQGSTTAKESAKK